MLSGSYSIADAFLAQPCLTNTMEKKEQSLLQMGFP